MTIEERTKDILKFHKLDSIDLLEMEKLVNEYVSLFNENKVLQEVFLDPLVSHMYLENNITKEHFFCYLRSIINYGNRFNLSDEEFLNDFKMANELLICCMKKYDYFSGFKTYYLSDSNLYNDIYSLMKKVGINDDIPRRCKEFILISIYKNINYLGYRQDDYDIVFDRMRDLYKDLLNDSFIIEHLIQNNMLDNDNIYDLNINDLFTFINSYIEYKIKTGKRNIITR